MSKNHSNPNKSASSVHTDCLPPAGPNDGAADTCIEKWKMEKDAAKRNLDQKVAELEQAKKQLENALAWEAKLKTYFDNLQKTAEVSDKLRRELGVMIAQTDKVCTNSGYTIEVLECLFFQVEAIYNESVSSILVILELLQKCIKCITDPALVRDKGITKAITDLEAKIKELDGLHLDAIKKVIEALKCAFVLHYSICDEADGDEDFKGDALLCDLNDLLNSLGGPISDSAQQAAQTKGAKPSAPKTALSCRLNKEELLPMPVFPLESDAYYLDIMAQYTQAGLDKSASKNTYDQLKKEKESKQSCYDSLTDAIETADKTKNGK